MTELVIAGAAIIVSAISSHAFHSWLRQRERERLTATDKAELVKRFEQVEAKLLELKNTALSRQR